jgi:hypothetical protein
LLPVCRVVVSGSGPRRQDLGWFAIPGGDAAHYGGFTREWRNGRRAGFRCQCPKGRGGSNPPSRTLNTQDPGRIIRPGILRFWPKVSVPGWLAVSHSPAAGLCVRVLSPAMEEGGGTTGGTDFVAAVPPPPSVAPAPRSRRPPLLQSRKGLAKVGGGLAGVALLLAVVGQMQAPATVTPSVLATRTTSAPASSSPTPSATPTVRGYLTPKLAGLTLAQVKARLTSAGLALGTVKHRPASAAAETVVSQSSPEGNSVAKGTRVDVVLAAPLPKVPSVVGKSRASATAALTSAGFSVRVTTRVVTHGVQGAVLSQTPSAGSALMPGSQVTVVVANVVKPVATQSCTPGYDPCLPPASDYDCAGGSGNGPEYVYGTVRVTGSDPYGLDRDGDGYGCE